jgi:hypothetical protein
MANNIGNERQQMNDDDDDDDEEEQPPLAEDLGQQDEDDQQEDGNDNIDDEEEQEDGNDNIDDEEELNFGQLCLMLMYDSPNLTEYKTPPLNDEDAAQLGASLYHSTNLKKLVVTVGPNFTARGAARVLGNGIQQSKIQFLGLRGDALGSSVPANVASVLFQMAIQTVTSVLLDFRLTEDDAAEMGNAFCSVNSLESLSFMLPFLTPITARSLAQGINRSLIKALVIVGRTMDHSEEVMRPIYLEGIHGSQVNSIALYFNIGDIHDMVIILPTIQSLSIKFVQLSIVDMQLLVAGLKTAQQLDNLIFWRCLVTDDHMRIFTTEFLNHAAVRKKIEENCGTPFHLGLDDNAISPIAAQRLMQATFSVSAFETLGLSNNPTIGYEGLRLIGEALPNSKLKELALGGSVNWVDYDDDDDGELAQAQEMKRDLAAKALVEGMRSNIHLQILNIDGLHFPSTAIAEIDFYVNMNFKFGRHLLSQQHSLPPTIWSLLLAKFSHELSVVFFYVRELPMLVPGGNAGNVGEAMRQRRV